MEDAASRGPESMPEQTSSVCLRPPPSFSLLGTTSASLSRLALSDPHSFIQPRIPFMTILHALCQLINSNFYFKMFLISSKLFSFPSHPTGYCLPSSFSLFFPTCIHTFLLCAMNEDCVSQHKHLISLFHLSVTTDSWKQAVICYFS